MEYKQLKNIRDLAADQFKNFEESVRLFGDLLNWAERVKEYISPSNMQGEWKVREYALLLHQASNAFLNSLINEMKLHHFHALAILRIGIDAVSQMAIIEVNFEDNLHIWKNINHCSNVDPRRKQYKKEYDKVFIYDRGKHDYSKFLSDVLKEELHRRWSLCSEVGSHPSFTSTVFSILPASEKKFHSGVFDYVRDDWVSVGVNISSIIDTFILLSQVATRILEQHDQKLRYSSEELEVRWNEWYSHKKEKAKEWGIARDEGP